MPPIPFSGFKQSLAPWKMVWIARRPYLHCEGPDGELWTGPSFVIYRFTGRFKVDAGAAVCPSAFAASARYPSLPVLRDIHYPT